MKEEKESKIHSVFNKEVYSFQLFALKNDFSEDGKLNARGRMAIRIGLVILWGLYFLTDQNLVSSLSLISLISIILPIEINTISTIIRKREEIKEWNLYDMLFCFGVYFLTILPTIGILIILIKQIRIHTKLFESFTLLPSGIILIAALFLVYDIILVLKEKRERK